ncbi:MAG: hypothetical protein WBE92_04915, partial [Steroidobacteraceae bacterium]
MTPIERAPQEPAPQQPGPQDRGVRESQLEEHEIVACPDCGLWQRLQRVPRGFRAECRRCRKGLARPPSRTLDAALALVTAALLV